VDDGDDGDFDTTTNTDYLIDSNNHTGYAQVIEEWDPDTPNMDRSYVIGQDHVAQWDDATNDVLYLLPDGHGSTRLVVDDESTPVIQETYDYDAYGNLIDGPSSPLTTLLYTGEQFNATTGQYYLRARYYSTRRPGSTISAHGTTTRERAASTASTPSPVTPQTPSPYTSTSTPVQIPSCSAILQAGCSR